jgi:hypothetical protein
VATASGGELASPTTPSGGGTGKRPATGATPPAKTGPQAKRGKPAYCNPTAGYDIQSDGTKRIKPECIPYL